ncbi:MAG TPA: condensation domain-containing protein, partial [Thermoanaerobaculia bacterium]
GETLPGELAARWSRGRRLLDAYGPTETTVCATAGRYRPGEARPSIGRAIAGVRTAVVDPGLGPLAPGEAGELVVGGAGLARGYLGRPALTAERFVPDPLDGAAPGGRLYRTGDLARELPDGRLDFLGRMDHQVKIRGHRVEPGEVEAALAAHPAVRAAAVVARPGPSGEPRLLAYAVAPDAPAGELRAYLASRLPRYLVPAALVRLDGMPLLPSGKVDRAALPEPVLAAGPDRDGGAPRTGTEAALAGIWRELLGVAEPAPDDDFFELGGHSLAVGRLVARVRRDLGVELAPGAVFEGRTLAAVARAVEVASEPPLPPVERAPRDRPLPLTFPQERVWFLEQLAPGNVAYHAMATVRFEGPLRPPVLRAALAEIVRRHEVFRSRFFAEDGRPWQEPLARVAVALPAIDLRALPAARREGEVARLVRREGRRPFDLARPPLVRWRLLLEEPGAATLLQVEHHLAHDGWSFAVLLDELRRLYAAFAAGLPSPLPAPPAQIGDLAAWQRRVVAGERLRRLLGYWTGRLAGAPPALELPADRPRPPAPSFRGEALRIELPAALAGALREEARTSGTTLFAIMLAAFQALLARYTGEDDVVVGSGVANRRTAEAERVIGMVVETLALRMELGTDLVDGPAFRPLVARVAATLLGAHAHQDLPLERLIDALRLPRDPSRNPLFQVLFSFHDSAVPDLDLGEVRGRVLERHNGSAKADLNVVVIPRAEQRLGRRDRSWEGAADEAVTLIWEWSSDLFDRSTMLRMVGHYRNLLAAALAEPERPVAALAILSRPERAQLLAGWNDTAVAYPGHRSIPELFAEVAAARPEAVALRQGECWWTYGELARRSARVAARLRA